MFDAFSGLFGSAGEFVIFLGAIAAATGALWRFWLSGVVRAIKNVSADISEATRLAGEMKSLLQTQLLPNGGSTFRDDVIKVVRKQDQLIKKQNELIEWMNSHKKEHDDSRPN